MQTSGMRYCRECKRLREGSVKRRTRSSLSPSAPEWSLIQVIDLSARFWPRINKTATCWLWTGSKNRSGYGHLKVCRRYVAVHRISWQIANGKAIPDGLLACHHCDTPLCVNPEHLFLGTHTDNMRDMHAKGRGGVRVRRDGVSACRRGHVFTPGTTYWNTPSKRACRICIRLRKQTTYRTQQQARINQPSKAEQAAVQS